MAAVTNKNKTTKVEVPKVKSILITQPKPESDKSPYFDLAKKYNIKIDFRSFIHVEGISYKDFRKDKINFQEHTAVIFTSRNAVEHFFRVCEEMKWEVPADMKYFCLSESTALYMQKFTQYRKRKIFFGKSTADELLEILNKHANEKFLFPCSDVHKEELPIKLKASKLAFSEAVIYKTVCSDLSDLADVKYDVLAFFSPSGIKSLFLNFPKFEQGPTRIAIFGPTTAKAVIDANLRIDIQAPSPSFPSMTMALEDYIKKTNK